MRRVEFGKWSVWSLLGVIAALYMVRKRRKTREYFHCPHCGAEVEVGALACRECGSDAQTGWSEDADLWEAEIPTAYGSEDDFDYDETISHEFPEAAAVPIQRLRRKWAILAVVAMVCIGLLLYVLAP